MKTQRIYHVTAVEKIEDIIEASGVIQGITRNILFDGKMSAVTPRAAEQKALKGILYDPDNLEVAIDLVNFPGQPKQGRE